MSEYTFKNLNEIDNVTEPADGTTVMGFENGTPIQMPMSAIKGSGGVFIINPDDSDYSTTDTAYGNKVKEAFLSGKNVFVYSFTSYETATPPNEGACYTIIYQFVVMKNLTDSTYSLLGYMPGGNDPLSFAITVD